MVDLRGNGGGMVRGAQQAWPPHTRRSSRRAAGPRVAGAVLRPGLAGCGGAAFGAPFLATGALSYFTQRRAELLYTTAR